MWKLLRKIAQTGRLTEEIPPRKKTTPSRFSGSLAIRHVDAGSCNGCELELQALGNPFYSIESQGMKFVASPRHADVLLVTGPVTCAMKGALLATHEATPSPKKVLAVGDCARDGGVFRGSYAVHGGVGAVLEVDVFVPGCPPEPAKIIEGLRAAFASHKPKADPSA